MPAFLLGPLGRYAAVAAVCAGLVGWAWLERAGRQVAAADAREARAEVAALHQRIRQMEVRRREEDRVAREPDPTQRLRDEWSRPE
jgi:hypothetical protein